MKNSTHWYKYSVYYSAITTSAVLFFLDSDVSSHSGEIEIIIEMALQTMHLNDTVQNYHGSSKFFLSEAKLLFKWKNVINFNSSKTTLNFFD